MESIRSNMTPTWIVCRCFWSLALVPTTSSFLQVPYRLHVATSPVVLLGHVALSHGSQIVRFLAVLQKVCGWFVWHFVCLSLASRLRSRYFSLDVFTSFFCPAKICERFWCELSCIWLLTKWGFWFQFQVCVKHLPPLPPPQLPHQNGNFCRTCPF